MKVTIQLYGTLLKKFPDYKSADGIEVELPDGSGPEELLDHLEIPESWGAVIAMDNRILNTGDSIRDGSRIKIFQTMHGG